MKRVWRGVWVFSRRKPVGGVSLAILLLFLILAILGPWIVPHNPLWMAPKERFQGPSLEHWFGTDEMGRDLFSRVIVGARMSYIVGMASTLLALFLGGVVAITSAYYGGRYDLLVQRLVDMFMAIPVLVLAMAFVIALGPSLFNVILSIGLAVAPRISRVIRSTALSIRETEYVMAARALGATAGRVMWRHIAPNTFATAIIISAALLGTSVLTEASLSFLGIGVPPPAPSWGRSLSEAQRWWASAPWLGVFPGIALSLFVLAANLLGDTLRDELDPRLKRV